MVHSHSIYVVGSGPAAVDWRHEVLGRIRKHISGGYAVAYVVDESESAAIRDLLGKVLPVDDYIDKGLLTLVNRDVFYSPFVPSKILLEQWNKLFASIEKKAGSVKGFVAMGMPADSFFLSEMDNQQLVRYESLASKRYNGTMEAMCIYTVEMIQRMPLRHVISLLNAHQNTGHKDGALREWGVRRGLELIARGLDSALGPGMSGLVLPILARDFGLDEEALVLQPGELERRLELLLGPAAARIAVEHLKNELCRDIVY